MQIAILTINNIRPLGVEKNTSKTNRKKPLLADWLPENTLPPTRIFGVSFFAIDSKSIDGKDILRDRTDATSNTFTRDFNWRLANVDSQSLPYHQSNWVTNISSEPNAPLPFPIYTCSSTNVTTKTNKTNSFCDHREQVKTFDKGHTLTSRDDIIDGLRDDDKMFGWPGNSSFSGDEDSNQLGDRGDDCIIGEVGGINNGMDQMFGSVNTDADIDRFLITADTTI